MNGKVKMAVFSPEDLTMLKMIYAIADIVGIDADTLAGTFMQPGKLQAYHDCFASVVAEELGFDDNAQGEEQDESAT